MASTTLFKSLPPFPEDVPIATISKISLAKLVSRSKSEAELMLEACQELGFFLLDLTGDPVGEAMIKEVDVVFEIVQQTMHLSMEEKIEYKQKLPDIRGYKAQGFTKTETGAPDRCEFFNIGQDDLFGKKSEEEVAPMPQPVQAQRSLLESYFQHGHYAIAHIVRTLASELEIPSETFVNLQSPERPSGTIMRMIRACPSATPDELRTSLVPHTDFGTVTLLANCLGGLQVLTPGHEPEDAAGWRWVRPEPGCLIVNLGDAMVQWTGGALRSNMHRINHCPGEQRFAERFSAAMLVRPYKEASMRRLVGGRIPSEEDDRREGIETAEGDDIGGLTAFEWETKKVAALRNGQDCAKSRGGRKLKPAAIVV